MKTAKAVIFDMDGVIVDSEGYWRITEKQLLSRISRKWSNEDKERTTAVSLDYLYSYVKDNLKIHVTKDEFDRKFDELALVIYKEKVTLIPGVLELIRKLSTRGMPIAIVSSSPKRWVDMVIERFSLGRFFKLIVTPDDLNGKGKPAPDIYLLAAKRLGIQPRDCMAIEDSRNGVESAKAAGMFCIGYNGLPDNNQDLSKADLIVNDLNKIDIGGI